jgi:hypothetical protein
VSEPLTFVTYHCSETLEDTFRSSDGDEFGYQIPSELITRLESADRARSAAIAAIKRHIEEQRIPEVDLETEESTGEENPW